MNNRNPFINPNQQGQYTRQAPIMQQQPQMYGQQAGGLQQYAGMPQSQQPPIMYDPRGNAAVGGPAGTPNSAFLGTPEDAGLNPYLSPTPPAMDMSGGTYIGGATSSQAAASLSPYRVLFLVEGTQSLSGHWPVSRSSHASIPKTVPRHASRWYTMHD